MGRLTAFYTYDDAEAYWTKCDKNDYRGIESDLSFSVEAVDFLITLEKLAMVTGDKRFCAAIDALSERNIIQSYRWTFATPYSHVNGIEGRFEKRAVDLVNLMVSDGISARLSIANTVANMKWPGNSFAAAFKAVERLWRASRKPVE